MLKTNFLFRPDFKARWSRAPTALVTLETYKCSYFKMGSVSIPFFIVVSLKTSGDPNWSGAHWLSRRKFLFEHVKQETCLSKSLLGPLFEITLVSLLPAVLYWYCEVDCEKTDLKVSGLNRKFVVCVKWVRGYLLVSFSVCVNKNSCIQGIDYYFLQWSSYGSYETASLLWKQRFGSFACSPAQSANEEKHCLSGGNTKQVLCMCTYTHPLSPSSSVILLIHIGRYCLILFCANML